jgi:hypothetical protein
MADFRSARHADPGTPTLDPVALQAESIGLRLNVGSMPGAAIGLPPKVD